MEIEKNRRMGVRDEEVKESREEDGKKVVRRGEGS